MNIENDDELAIYLLMANYTLNSRLNVVYKE